jgi:TnpA family transposase
MMARRRLLTGEQWTKFLTTPIDERELIRHYTLGRDDLDIIATKRTARNRLGYAVLLCYLRHPGRVPDPDEIPPSALLTFVAHQVQGNELIG